MTAGFPAFCKSCGSVSWLPIHIDDARIVVLEGNFISCVRCGKITKAMDGIFEASNKIVSIIKLGQITESDLFKFAEILDDAYLRQITPQEFEKKAYQINNDLGKAASEIKKSSYGFFGFLVFTMLIVSQVVSCNVEIDANRLLEQMAHFSAEDVRTTVKKDLERAYQAQEKDAGGRTESAGDRPDPESASVPQRRPPRPKEANDN